LFVSQVDHLSLLLAFCSMFGAAVVSAVVPAVNAEVVLLAASAALPLRYAWVLITAATLGQMVGKVAMFYGGRGVKFLQRGRLKEKVDGLGDVMRRRNGATGWFVLTSAATGLPPFYMVSVASGLIGVPISQFAVLGTLGRFIRFAVVVMFPQAVKALLQ
jgi:membrane protein YqaA with SNARE-associated domain